MRRILYPFVGAVLGTFVTWINLPSLENFAVLSVPVTHWFEVKQIVIEDTVRGKSPRVTVDREIHRAFTASWITTLRHVHDGRFEIFCARNGRNDYTPHSALPEYTDLDWWMDITPDRPCDPMEPGRYMLDVIWLVEINGTPARIARKSSNIFEVKP